MVINHPIFFFREIDNTVFLKSGALRTDMRVTERSIAPTLMNDTWILLRLLYGLNFLPLVYTIGQLKILSE